MLPRFSEPGLYLVAISRNPAGGELDLRNAAAGSYFFSTTHEQDQTSYYYPLQIK
jgi:hypothetical protein